MSDVESGGDVRWRALRTGMWAARRDDRHLGTVERGHRWLAVGADSEPIGRFRTLGEAQAAVAHPASFPLPVQHRSAVGAGLLAAVISACAAALMVAVPVLSELIR